MPARTGCHPPEALRNHPVQARSRAENMPSNRIMPVDKHHGLW